MNTEKNLTTEEKETVLFVLNEFTEQYQENIKNMSALMGEIKELNVKVQQIIHLQEQQQRPDNNVPEQVKRGFEKLEGIIGRLSFPLKAMHELFQKLSALNQKLSQPLQQKVEHHHHVNKIIVAAGVLFIAVCFLCSGWYNTVQKLDGYIENDTKYRYLRLDTAQVFLQRYLDKADKEYTHNPKLRDSVITREKENLKNMKLLFEAYRKTREAEKLRSEAGRLQKEAGH